MMLTEKRIYESLGLKYHCRVRTLLSEKKISIFQYIEALFPVCFSKFQYSIFIVVDTNKTVQGAIFSHYNANEIIHLLQSITMYAHVC